jgi:hypothetical protein
VSGGVIRFQAEACPFVSLPKGSLVLDLEGIEVLADARIVVLSERLPSLIDTQGVMAGFPGGYGEVGSRGLERAAVRLLPGRAPRISVVWGGDLEPNAILQSLRGVVGGKALNPAIYVHDLKRGSSNAHLTLRDALRMAELDVPFPLDKSAPLSDSGRRNWFGIIFRKRMKTSWDLSF